LETLRIIVGDEGGWRAGVLKKVEVVWFHGEKDVMILVELVMDGIEGREGRWKRPDYSLVRVT
jgi:hypothetical protein